MRGALLEDRDLVLPRAKEPQLCSPLEQVKEKKSKPQNKVPNNQYITGFLLLPFPSPFIPPPPSASCLPSSLISSSLPSPGSLVSTTFPLAMLVLDNYRPREVSQGAQSRDPEKFTLGFPDFQGWPVVSAQQTWGSSCSRWAHCSLIHSSSILRRPSPSHSVRAKRRLLTLAYRGPHHLATAPLSAFLPQSPASCSLIHPGRLVILKPTTHSPHSDFDLQR